jgi:hypothetical protein
MDRSNEEQDELSRAIFRDRLLPIAKLVAERGIEIFPLAADPSSSTYYKIRSDNGVYIHEIDTANIAAELGEMWSDGNLPELADLAVDLIALAQVLRDEPGETEEISPFIYAMF